MFNSSASASTLRISDKHFLNRYESTTPNFLNKTIALYGSSNSGKSICIKEILFTLRDVVPFPIIFNATEMTNKTFSKIIQAPLIHTAFDMKMLQNIWERQEKVLQIYNVVNDINILKSILLAFANSSKNNIKETIISKLEILKDEYIDRVKDKKEKIINENKNFNLILDETQEKIFETEIFLIKKTIKDIKKKIDENDVFYKDIYRNKLNSNQRYVVKFIDINPNIIIVMDDCAADLKQFLKHEILRRFFYQSRHLKITLIIAAQDETDIDANFRKNIHLTIFCDMNCTISFFDRKSNGFGTNYRKIANECCNVIFNDSTNIATGTNTINMKKKHLKLVYNKEHNEKFFWFKANVNNHPSTYIFNNPMINKFIGVDDNTTSSLNSEEHPINNESIGFYSNDNFLKNIVNKI